MIVDGTQDCSGTEQLSICIRYVSKDLEPHEAFVGFYEPTDTKGNTIAGVIQDALLRLCLPIECLRSQTYDGAANMAGEYNGCQAIIAKVQPLALHFHCAAHRSNLVMQKADMASKLVRDALQYANELGVLISRSGKFKSIFANIAASENESVSSIRPLCPTRWLCRGSTIRNILDQYTVVLQSLEEMSTETNSETAARAGALLGR